MPQPQPNWNSDAFPAENKKVDFGSPKTGCCFPRCHRKKRVSGVRSCFNDFVREAVEVLEVIKGETGDVLGVAARVHTIPMKAANDDNNGSNGNHHHHEEEEAEAAEAVEEDNSDKKG